MLQTFNTEKKVTQMTLPKAVSFTVKSLIDWKAGKKFLEKLTKTKPVTIAEVQKENRAMVRCPKIIKVFPKKKDGSFSIQIFVDKRTTLSQVLMSNNIDINTIPCYSHLWADNPKIQSGFIEMVIFPLEKNMTPLEFEKKLEEKNLESSPVAHAALIYLAHGLIDKFPSASQWRDERGQFAFLSFDKIHNRYGASLGISNTSWGSDKYGCGVVKS
jgi:uncharacterized protein YlaN (UPF0358 family)